jgi:hypothetical protein
VQKTRDALNNRRTEQQTSLTSAYNSVMEEMKGKLPEGHYRNHSGWSHLGCIIGGEWVSLMGLRQSFAKTYFKGWSSKDVGAPALSNPCDQV